ncbi:MAG: GAF domain-containing protein [Candidatus Omnitrophota bacterium]
MSIKIDYKKELEALRKDMMHDHVSLINFLVGKAGVKHAGIILFESSVDSYVLTASQGETGDRIPEGFLRFEKTHPLIHIFYHKEYKYLMAGRTALLFDDIDRMIWHESFFGQNIDSREILQNVREQMPMFNSVACVPAFYRHQLVAVLLLGSKLDNTRFEQDELDFFSALASNMAVAIYNT